jgi:predicted aldo/keto reductase-like oxidoreductase
MLDRRTFLQIAAAWLAAWSQPMQALAPQPSSSGVPTRLLGSTGERVSCIGLGGYHIANQDTVAESLRIIRTAIDHGMTFMDNSWDYHDGDSERRMGQALRDGYRHKVFLMTKIDGRTREAAARQIDESLRRLQTDHIDLLQFHEIIRMSDPERIMAPGGAMEAAEAARKAGKIRFIGFTGHKDPKIHLQMIATGYRFATAQMPLNIMDAHYRSFQHEVVPVCQQKGIGVLGMKSMGDSIILRSGLVKAPECLRYSLSLPASVVITGCDSLQNVQQAVHAAVNYRPFQPEELAELLQRTRTAAESGKYEPFKNTREFDSTSQNPQWMG